ncbi:LamG domain-containing protein [Pseudonocardia sp. WMMC193]|uniref:LamG domain-containing protein n=1 Tax=Pseudonocardia sp. WMMC193 TaxID=2911965 RepID=UPI001F32D841|nr:LamG domain-containing protein [Pseudonocardia sp. WMMC193]MCF7553846.1 PKD domain-containing protein [Pseudonocardia sp. WMMC193]
MGLPALAAPAYADTAPPPATPPTTPTVAADSLPTVQINGVVWDQVTVGNTVYATGRFTSARPAGSAAGSNETARSNILAFNLSTGALITSWAPSLNAQGLTIAASADGSTIYVGGDFTQVSGTTRSRIAALDAATGAVKAFNPVAGTTVRAIAVDGSTVYVGGGFASMGGQARTKIAAVDATSGAVKPWAPYVDADVLALTVPAGKGTVVAGGRFQFAGASAAQNQEVDGLGVFSTSTAALQPWAAYGIFPNYGPRSAIWSLTSDASQVYGTAYDFGGPAGDPFEGTFAVDAATGTVNAVLGCKGDTYDTFPVNGVLYSTGHPHNCEMVGGHPQTEPWTYQRALATTLGPAADGRVNTYGRYQGYKAPEILQWLPTYPPGTFTGQGQAGWSVTGNSQYVAVGGEFPSVNGVAQQGLSRFAISSIAPNKEGPQANTSTTLKPTLVSLAPGTARISWQAAWDRDNKRLTYEVLRGSTVANSTVLTTLTADSNWWNRPQLSFTDTTAPAGTQNYRIRVKDAFNNTIVSNLTAFTVDNTPTAPSPYGDAVRADAPTSYWRLGETSGTTGYDWIAAADLTVDGSATRNVTGPLPDGNNATGFSGTAAVPAAMSGTPIAGPQTFTVEAWINTTSTAGGKIVGFGNSNTGDSGSYDRHLYMGGDGKVYFGVYPNFAAVVQSAKALNDGQWHHLVGTLGPAGQALYVDGKRAGSRTDVTAAQAYSGYWRVGGDNFGGWPGSTGNNKFVGAIDEVAVYPNALSFDQVQAHYIASGRTLAGAAAPTDAYGAAIYAAQPSAYWRLGDTGTTMTDTSRDQTGIGTYYNGPVQGATGVPGMPGTAVRFTGQGSVGASSDEPVNNPTTYSEELWFNTTTTVGGKLIGFGNERSGNSSGYDRHVWMMNDGRLVFGTWTGQTNTAESPVGTAYNDGAWHHMVATQGTDGMKLYVDGALVATNPQTAAQDYSGYWRLGGDVVWYGANSFYFDGTLDEAAVYPTVLTPAQVLDHYTKGGGVVNQAPVAAFTSTTAELTADLDASTSTDDGTIASYAWNFGDGATGTGQTASHPYAAAGTYDVTLTVTDDKGLTNSVTRQVTVAANLPPTAAFTATTDGLEVNVDGSGSIDPDGTIASYAWDFGDGGTATGVTATHTYGAAGTFTINLTVTDDKGRTHTQPNEVTVTPNNAAPVAAFTTAVTDLSVAVDGTGSSDADGTIATWAWQFGDGGTATTPTATHAYAAAGSYQVTLTVTDDKGASTSLTKTVTATAANVAPTAAFAAGSTNLTASFDASESSDPDGTIASYAWNFGDGTPAGTGKTPTHAYAAGGTYQVTLTVTDDKGASGTLTKAITVAPANQAPTAAFDYTKAGLAANFDATASADPDGTIVSYAWDYGDNSPAGTGATSSHTYAAAGAYTVTLTVTDDKGATGTVSTSVTVAAPNQPPVSAFTYQATNLSVAFDGSTSSDAEGPIASYAWDFGDTGVGATATPTHVYAQPGTYQVELTVTDGAGATATATRSVTVAAANQPPTASFTAVVTDLRATFNATNSTDPDGTITGYAWQFGDNTTGTGTSVEHTYATPGTYTATLTVTDNGGATATTTRQVTVTAPAPTAYATDTFSRTVTGGFGSADTGGAWTLSAAGTSYSVSGGTGKISVAASKQLAAYLNGVSQSDTELTATVSVDKVQTSNGTTVSLIGRKVGNDDYRAKLRFASNGTLVLNVSKVVGGTETQLGGTVTVPGTTFTAGTPIKIKVQVTGTGTTTVSAKAWAAAAAAEPAAWQLTVTDTATSLQAPGSVGVMGYLSGSATNGPIVVSVDDLTARRPAGL